VIAASRLGPPALETLHGPPGPSATSHVVQAVSLQPNGPASIGGIAKYVKHVTGPRPATMGGVGHAGATCPARSAEPDAALPPGGAVQLRARDRPRFPTVSVKSMLADPSRHVPGPAKSACRLDRSKGMPQ